MKRERQGGKFIDTSLGLVCDVCLAQFGDGYPVHNAGTLASGDHWPTYNFCPICGQPAKEIYDDDKARLVFLTVFGDRYKKRQLITLGDMPMRVTRIELCSRFEEAHLSSLNNCKRFDIYEVYAKPVKIA